MRHFIFGAGGHAKVIADNLHYDPMFVVPEKKSHAHITEADFFERIGDYRKDKIYLGIGHQAVRKKLFLKLIEHGITAASLVPFGRASISRKAWIGVGVIILPGSVIAAGAMIGDNTIINHLSGIDHDCEIGAHSQVTVGVTFGGDVKVGTDCFFGMKSAVFPQIKIGDNVTVRGGSIVTKDVASGVTVGGNPAQIIKQSHLAVA